MIEDDKSHDLASAFDGLLQLDPGQTKAGTAKHRKEAERQHRLSPEDGRRKNATGRTKQCNVKMRPDMHRWLVSVARKRNCLMIEIIEEALDVWRAAGERSK